MQILRHLLLDESAQSFTEYAIVVGSLALGAMITFIALAGHLRDVFNNMQTQLNGIPTT